MRSRECGTVWESKQTRAEIREGLAIRANTMSRTPGAALEAVSHVREMADTRKGPRAGEEVTVGRDKWTIQLNRKCQK